MMSLPLFFFAKHLVLFTTLRTTLYYRFLQENAMNPLAPCCECAPNFPSTEDGYVVDISAVEEALARNLSGSQSLTTH